MSRIIGTFFYATSHLVHAFNDPPNALAHKAFASLTSIVCTCAPLIWAGETFTLLARYHRLPLSGHTWISDTTTPARGSTILSPSTAVWSNISAATLSPFYSSYTYWWLHTDPCTLGKRRIVFRNPSTVGFEDLSWLHSRWQEEQSLE
jgi:hypothetical protein